MQKKIVDSDEVVRLPIELVFPEGQLGVLANHFVIQREGPEFHLLFFQTHAPIILGATPEERQEAFKAADKARSICVARIIVSAERLPAFVAAMQENLGKSCGTQERADQES